MNEAITNNAKTEKLRVALYTRGAGVILFALWSFLRVFLISFAGSGGYDTQLPSVVTFLVDFIIGGIDSWLRVYVGRCAISFSRGEKLHRFSLFLAGFFAVAPPLILALYFMLVGFSLLPLSVMIGLVVDIAVVVLNIEIILFSLQLKKAEA